MTQQQPDKAPSPFTPLTPEQRLDAAKAVAGLMQYYLEALAQDAQDGTAVDGAVIEALLNMQREVDAAPATPSNG